MRKKLSVLAALAVILAAVTAPSAAYAATTTSLSQVINAGTMTYDVVDGSGVSIGSPSVAFPATTFDFSCQTKSATLGTPTQKIKIANPRLGGVKLEIAGSGAWTDGSKTYAYNDSTSDGTTAGCANGQMTVSSSGFTFNQTAGANSATYTTPVGAFDGSTPVTLFNNDSATAWEGELEGYTLSQRIPAEQADGNYSLSMTLTAITQ